MLNETLAMHNIVRLPLPPTRITSLLETSIDWICTNMNTNQLTTKVIDAGLSDHTAQSCAVNCNPNTSTQFRIGRCFKNNNLQNLKYLLSKENWQTVLSTKDAEEAFKIFLNIVNIALNSACPQKKIKISHKQKLKFLSDPEANKLKNEYLKALRKFEITGDVNDKQLMSEHKKTCDLHLKLLRKQASSDHLQNSENKSKAMWEIINSSWSKKETNMKRIHLEVNGRQINKVTDVAEHLNTFFTSIAQKTLLPQKNLKTKNVLMNIPQPPQFCSFQDTSEKEIKKIINQLKTKNSSGMDEISSKALKLCCNELVLPLVDVINKSLNTGHFPSQLKTTKVFPKFKSGNTNEASNYRPISLVSTFSKIYEKVVLNRLLNHCTEHNLLSDSQRGFTKGKSTTTAIVQMVESLVDGLEEGNLTTAMS
uniref:Uncharacterized protein n=1 Tax=Homalodisca liturata TaxID=320908 RepID=A0A1B6JDN9_9HEMI